MANEVEICNAALNHIAANTIESLTENSREAEVCNSIYGINRDATLRDVDWSFARKGPVALAEISEDNDQWDYVYAVPTDSIEVREIFNSAKGSDDDLIPFERGVSESGDTQIVLTDEYQAKAIYTRRITNASVYDALFVSAFALRLGSALAYPIHRDSELRDKLFRMYQMEIAKAEAKSKNERFHLPDPSNDYVAARG